MASKKPSGLGRGLGALLGDDVMKTESSGSLSLPISQVETCSSQPRKRFDDESLQELADSISQHGIIQPLTVRKLSSGYYQIIAGERRWRAARLAGLQEVPVIVIEADDRKAAELAMIENLQREDLNPMEEAAGFQSLIESYHMTQEEAAQRVSRSRPAVANAMRLLTLDESVREAVKDGRLSHKKLDDRVRAAGTDALRPKAGGGGQTFRRSRPGFGSPLPFPAGKRGQRHCQRRTLRPADRGSGQTAFRREERGAGQRS